MASFSFSRLLTGVIIGAVLYVALMWVSVQMMTELNLMIFSLGLCLLSLIFVVCTLQSLGLATGIALACVLLIVLGCMIGTHEHVLAVSVSDIKVLLSSGLLLPTGWILTGVSLGIVGVKAARK